MRTESRFDAPHWLIDKCRALFEFVISVYHITKCQRFVCIYYVLVKGARYEPSTHRAHVASAPDRDPGTDTRGFSTDDAISAVINAQSNGTCTNFVHMSFFCICTYISVHLILHPEVFSTYAVCCRIFLCRVLLHRCKIFPL